MDRQDAEDGRMPERGSEAAIQSTSRADARRVERLRSNVAPDGSSVVPPVVGRTQCPTEPTRLYRLPFERTCRRVLKISFVKSTIMRSTSTIATRLGRFASLGER